MSSSTVFITGASGFIGAQVVQSTLQAGYKAKLSVRREAQIEDLRRVFSDYADKLDFVVVPDYTVRGAFDEALQGSDHVIHIASPLAIPGQDLLTPAKQGTLSILESAAKISTIKKVVITASVASLIPLGSGQNVGPEGLEITESIDKKDLYFDESIVPSLEPMGQYQASKIASYTATLDFIEENKPQFSVVTLHPVFVYGRNLLQTKAEELTGSNGMLFGSFFADEPMFAPYRGVHVLDVAEAHIKALTLADAPVSSFLMSASDRTWEEALEFVKKEYPAVGVKVQPKDGAKWNVDTTRAREILGFETWREMEVQIKDVFDQQLQLRGA